MKGYPLGYEFIQGGDWPSVVEFMDWYMENGRPINFGDQEVFCTDDATAVCLFRRGQFQVELYLIHPNPLVQVHEHPGVDVIKMRIINDMAIPTGVLIDGNSHGDGMRLEGEGKGFPLLAFQHWKNSPPTTIASSWKGETAGPKHNALIKRFHPNAFNKPGYADITLEVQNEPNI